MPGLRRRRGTGFAAENIFGDPFALATSSVAILGWIVAFTGNIISELNITNGFEKYSWWVLAYEFVYIIGGIIVIASGSVTTYSSAMVGFASTGIAMTTILVNQTIYNSTSYSEATSAGFIVLAIVNIVWVLYFGSAPEATHRGYIDSFALGKDPNMYQREHSQPMSVNHSRPLTNAHAPPSLPQMYTSAQLNGFETSSPISSYPLNGSGARIMGTAPASRGMTSPPRSPPPNQLSHDMNLATAANTALPDSSGPSHSGELPATSDYAHKAKAIYSYEANPDDANEISFAKHEVLEVSDISGRWWQARKENGETGIAPSNYLILLNE